MPWTLKRTNAGRKRAARLQRILSLLAGLLIMLIPAFLLVEVLPGLVHHFFFMVKHSMAIGSADDAAPDDGSPNRVTYRLVLNVIPDNGLLNHPLIDPVTPLVRHAALLVQQNKTEEALYELSTAIQAAPNNKEAYQIRSSIYAKEKHWDLAEKDFRALSQLDANDFYVKFDLAEIQFQQREYDAARPGFAALEQDPKIGDLAAYKVFLCDLFGGHEDVAAQTLDLYNQAGRGEAYYFANAAWSFYHQKPQEGLGWVGSAEQNPETNDPNAITLYSTSLIDLGYLTSPPVARAQSEPLGHLPVQENTTNGL